MLRAIVALLLLAAPASAQTWQTHPDHPDQLFLFHDGRQLGAFVRDAGTYRPLLDATTRTFGPPCEAPLPLPPGWEPENFGIDLAKLGTAGYRLDGQDVSRGEALAALDQLPDDAHLPRLTLIGTPDDCGRVRAALGPLAALLVLQEYRPDNPLLAGLGFVTAGSPAVYLQAPDGKVLTRFDRDPGPQLLNVALRRARADYDPAKDVEVAKPDAAKALPGWLWPALAGLVVSLPTLKNWLGGLWTWFRTRREPPADELRRLIREELRAAAAADKPTA